MRQIRLDHEEVVRILLEHLSKDGYGFLETEYGKEEQIELQNGYSLMMPEDGLIFTKRKDVKPE